jgi:hypothetical protein
VDGWDTQDIEEIVVGGRRMRVGRRRLTRGPKPWVIALILVVLAGTGVGGYFWLTSEPEADTIPNPAVVASGGFRADIGVYNTITIGLVVNNRANIAVTLIEARVVAPAGLTSTALAIVPTGEGNEGLALDGDLPPTVPVELGVAAADKSAIIAARFTVNCDGLLAEGASTTEQIFVTVRVGEEQREEELTPPVVGDEPWLYGAARRACLDPVPTGTPDQPLPPDSSDSPGPGQTP